MKSMQPFSMFFRLLNSVTILIMKTLLLSSIVCFASFGLFAQEQSSKTNNDSSVQGLTYSPQLPKADSYRVVKNHKSITLSKEILLEINKQRKADEDVIWKPEEGVEILIYKRKK